MRHQASRNRYLLARLRPFGRPIVWAPSIGLVLLGLFAWEFWSRSDSMSSFKSTPLPSNASSRNERAAIADIDSTSLLMRDAKVNPYATLFGSAASDSSVKSPSDSSNSQSAAPTEAASAPQPNRTSASNNAAMPQLGLPNAAQPLAPTALDSDAATPLPQNQLQSAMSRVTPSSATPSSNPSFTRSVYGGTPPIEGTTSTNRAPANSYTNLVEGSRSFGASQSESLPPQPTSIPNITPSTPPTSVENVAPTTPQSSVNASPNFGTTQNNSEINSQPFTAPRSTPGRYIGGGSINTFSNP